MKNKVFVLYIKSTHMTFRPVKQFIRISETRADKMSLLRTQITNVYNDDINIRLMQIDVGLYA